MATWVEEARRNERRNWRAKSACIRRVSCFQHPPRPHCGSELLTSSNNEHQLILPFDSHYIQQRRPEQHDGGHDARRVAADWRGAHRRRRFDSRSPVPILLFRPVRPSQRTRSRPGPPSLNRTLSSPSLSPRTRQPTNPHDTAPHSIASVSGDLSSLTAPPFILSPVSLTEFPAYWCERPVLFAAIADARDAEDRALRVLRWFVSTLKGQYTSRNESMGSEKKCVSCLAIQPLVNGLTVIGP